MMPCSLLNQSLVDINGHWQQKSWQSEYHLPSQYTVRLSLPVALAEVVSRTALAVPAAPGSWCRVQKFREEWSDTGGTGTGSLRLVLPY